MSMIIYILLQSFSFTAKLYIISPIWERDENETEGEREMKKNIDWVLWGIILIAIGIFTFNQVTMFQFKNKQSPTLGDMPMMNQRLSMMSLTQFDVKTAKKLMDKDGDGFCDACGMPIDQCIASGMMQCNMDPDAKIGVLGSQHIHAGWKIYINGQPFDWSPYADRHERQMKGDTSVIDTSAFMHIHPAQPPEKVGDILHMHAAGVPLSLFFESMGMSFDSQCLQMMEEKLCSDDKSTLKFYVNGKPNKQYGDYVFKDLDKILISYGQSSESLDDQLASLTKFAGDH